MFKSVNGLEVAHAKEREEENKEWNMKIINAVSTVDGTDVMNMVWCSQFV